MSDNCRLGSTSETTTHFADSGVRSKEAISGAQTGLFFPISLMKGRFIRLVRRVLVSRFRLVRRRLIPSVTAGHPRGQDSSSNRFHWAITTQLPTLSEVA